tara:strand:- start:844 stop:1836 length:993 start_codon:yes stop_codon:yes gene_type:complete
MPEITIYTNDGDCANGVAEINPFTVGDATDEWTLKFNDGTNLYSPSNVTMRVGHTNGLPDGTYSNAFKWVDRTDNQSTGSIVVSSGVPALTFDIDPAGGVVGTDGVYILRGPELDGVITSIEILDAGYDLTVSLGINIDGTRLYPVGDTSTGGIYSDPVINTQPSGTSFASAVGTRNNPVGLLDYVTLHSGGSGFQSAPTVYLQKEAADGNNSRLPSLKAIGNWAEYEFPFMRDESGNDIIAGTTLSPYSDGSITGTTQYDHSTLVIRPETVATAYLVSSGLDWVGTMDPINAYTTSRLSLRNSTQLDLQIRGDDRTLFQGQLTILNKIN